MSTQLQINGRRVRVDSAAETPLLWVLRDELGMTGTKYGCGVGLCGACTVHVGNDPARACITPVGALARRQVRTIEGLGQDRIGRALQAAWIANDVPQCGYCQCGQLMSAAVLLRTTPVPSDRDITETMAGNICRCGTYDRIRAAILEAARTLSV